MITLPFLKKNGSTDDASSGSWMLDLRCVQKYYTSPAGDYQALKCIDLQVSRGEFVSIIGKSGSGKSTLLNMISGIDRPTTGEVWVNGTALHAMGEDQMARWRGGNLGILFQFFQLLPALSILQNVILPMDLAGKYSRRERRTRGRASTGARWLARSQGQTSQHGIGRPAATRSSGPRPRQRSTLDRG